MSLKTKLLQLPENKVFFSIGEVAKLCSIEASAIRYWEKEIEQLNPKINNKQRRYQKKEIDLIIIIKSLLYDEKLTIKGAIKRLNKSSSEEINSIDNILISEVKKELACILKLIKEES